MAKYAKCGTCGYTISIGDDMDASDYVCPVDGATLEEATRTEYMVTEKSAATFIVAASDSLHMERADYVCDGVDDQVEIQEAIDALPSGGGKVVSLDGTFHTAKEIHILGVDNLILSGSGKDTHIITNAKFESNLSADASSGATTITVNSVVGFREGQRVIIVDDSSDISVNSGAGGGWDEKDILTISGNNIFFATGLSQDYTVLANSKVYTAYDVLKATTCDNIRVQDMWVDGNRANQAVGAKGRYSHAGIDLIKSSNSSIDNVYSTNCPNLAIRLDEVNDITISNCFLSSSLRGMCAYNYITPSRRITMLGTHSTGHSESGVRLCHVYDSLFVGNHFYGNTQSGIIIPNNSSNNAFIGNCVHDNMYGIITSNMVGQKSKNTIISGNIIHDNTMGLLLTRIEGFIISNNQVFNNARHGFQFYGPDCNSNLIIGNMILDNNLDEEVNMSGISFYSGTTKNKVLGNRISGVKQEFGIKIAAGNTDNVISDNILTGNIAAIYNGEPSTIIRNNIGYITKNSGSSTGTGAQQTIAHGLGGTPTKVILWNIEDGANPYQSAAADATNIYILAVINQDYGWEAEA